MHISSFSAYDGWEDDVYEMAKCEIHAMAGYPHHEMAKRLLAAFDPPKCGKELQVTGSALQAWKAGGHLAPIVCGLPRGHHPYEPSPGAFHGCKSCKELPGAPIHSQGHIPDVPRECWK